jgi:hypothetical protein
VSVARARRGFISIVATLSLLATVLLITATPSSAAPINGAITKIVVVPNRAGDTFRTELTWCIPNGSHTGDTFAVTLPVQTFLASQQFDVNTPDGQLLATADVKSPVPSVVTFTMTNYVETHSNVCGTAYFTSYLSSHSYAGSTQTFVYTTNSGQQFTTPVTIPSNPGINRNSAHKTGAFTRSDQCRTNTTDCIQWRIETPVGPSTSGTISDTVIAPQVIDCASVTVEIGDTSGNGGAFAHAAAYTAFTATCSTRTVTIRYGTVPANRLLRLTFAVGVSTPASATGSTFSNPNGRVSNVTPDGTTTTTVSTASVVSSAAGGQGAGVASTPAVSIRKDDANGNAADTLATAPTLGQAPAGVGLVFTVTNPGNEALVNVVVSDQLVANGTVTGLTCTFPDNSTGTTWAGPFAVGGSFKCAAQLSGVLSGTAHQDIATVNAVGQVSRTPVTSSNPYFALATPAPPQPAVLIIKDDVNGNAADTLATAPTLGQEPAGVALVFTIANSGTEALDNVVVSDQLVRNGTITGLSCTFPDGSTGTTWAGPFAIGASFGCTAQLSGVLSTTSHEDIATVNAIGATSRTAVTSSNPYFALALVSPPAPFTGVPGISVTKGDSNGNAADTVNDEAILPTGTATLVYVVTNSGTEVLTTINVSDLVQSNGVVTGLVCTFPDGTKGTTWKGRFAIGASFTCTASLADVAFGTVHEDTATAIGTGVTTGQTVTATNKYFAETPESVSPDELANTGSGDVTRLLIIALLAGAVGGILTMVGRKRSHS